MRRLPPINKELALSRSPSLFHPTPIVVARDYPRQLTSDPVRHPDRHYCAIKDQGEALAMQLRICRRIDSEFRSVGNFTAGR
jgi:hypothetical protein